MNDPSALPKGFRYRAFVSYCHADRELASKLMRRLERYRVPKRLVGTAGRHGPVPRKLSPLFRDREELPSGAHLGEHIQQALSESEMMIVIASPAAAASRWVSEEIRAFKQLGRGDRVHVYLIAGEPDPDAENNAFPKALLHEFNEAGEALDTVVEPIAADARDTGDGPKRAFGKLVAGLLGIRYSDLQQREVQRRQQRLVAITTASLVGLVITGGLALAAMVAREDADRRREQAEQLLGFMVGDLREQLEPLGRLDLLDRVGDEAMSYFASVEPGDLTDEGLARQAQALTQLGEVRLSQSRYTEAEESFREALSRSEELVRRNPNSGPHIFDRGQVEFWVGYVYYDQGDYERTQPWFERYLLTSEALSSLAPENVDWRIELAYAQHNLAVLELENGNFEEAEQVFEAQVGTWESLDCDEPACDDIKFDLADAYTWQGLAALRQGRLMEMRTAISGARETYAALRRSHPDDRLIEAEYADETNSLGRAAYWLGDTREAERYFDEALSHWRSLAAHDRENRDWLEHFLKEIADRVMLAVAVGDDALAGQLFLEAEELRALYALAPDEALTIRIRMQTLRGELQSLPVTERLAALASAQELNQLRDDNHDAMLPAILVAIAALERERGNLAEARRLAGRATALLIANEKDRMHPDVMQPWLRLLLMEDLNVRETSGALPDLETIRATGLNSPGLWPASD